MIMKAPEGMENCGDLPVFMDGESCASVWELSKEELEVIQKTGKVILYVYMGGAQPPVALAVDGVEYKEEEKV